MLGFDSLLAAADARLLATVFEFGQNMFHGCARFARNGKSARRL
jgi:hypothetical protein